MATQPNVGSGINVGGLNLAMLLPLVAGMLGDRKVTVGGRDYTIGPLIQELAADFADGKITPDEQRRLIMVIVAVFAAGTMHPVPVPVIPPAPPAPTPVTPPTPAPVTPAGVRITSARASILFGEGERKGGNNDGGRWDPAQRAQMKGERLHFDTTPTPDDPAYNETLVMADGHSPCWLPRWGRYVNGKRVFNSRGADGQPYAQQDEPDHFDLESYEKKGPQDTSGPGLTPVLLLEEQFGPGTSECFFFAVLPAEYNGGVAVETNEVRWRAD